MQPYTWEFYLTVCVGAVLVVLLTVFSVTLLYNHWKSKVPTVTGDEPSIEEGLPLLGQATKALIELFADGKMVKLNTAKGLKPVQMTLFNNKEVRWELTSGTSSQKKYKLDLIEVLYVQPGKQTKNFQNVNSVDEDNCLSLIFQSITLDIVVESQAEREIMVQGFIELVDSLKVSKV
jgi:methionine synthase II (cobalamin-independent)